MEREGKTKFLQTISPFLALLLPLIAYIITTPRDITNGIFGSDSGELIAASVTYGVPHPPGYPTWLILTRLFNWLPIGQSISHRYNLFSVVCMASGIVLLYFAVRKVVGRNEHGAPLAAALTTAFALTVWSQAVIAEVYALNSLMISITLVMLTKLEFDPPSWKVAGFAGLAAGLAATTHLTSVFLLPLAAIILIRRFKFVLPFGVGFAMGLLPFAFIPLWANSGSPIIWGNPTTVEGFWWLFSGQIYRGNVLSLTLSETVDRILPFFQWDQLNPGLLIPFGAILGIISEYDDSEVRPKRIFIAGTILVALLYGVYALTYRTGDWRVFILPANLLLAFTLAYGLSQFGWWSLCVPLLFIFINFPILQKATTDTLRQEIQQIMDEAPPSSILFTDGKDGTLFPIWYARYAEKQRPDTIVVDFNMLQFEWYRQRIQELDPTLLRLEIDDVEGFKLENSQFRPLCEISLQPFALKCTDG